MSALAPVGHNNPPGPLDNAVQATADLNAWLNDNPVIQSAEDAKSGALQIERTRIVIAELEDARTKETGPLNEALREINNTYRKVREPLKSLLEQLRFRLTDFAAREEAARYAQAEALRRDAEAHERAVREAEARAAEAIEGARLGQCDTDLATALLDVATAGADAGRAGRAADRAERDVPVRIPGQLGGRALAMRTKEVLVIDDCLAAINAMGWTPKITDAILSSARDFRRDRGELPTGIRAEHERSI